MTHVLAVMLSVYVIYLAQPGTCENDFIFIFIFLYILLWTSSFFLLFRYLIKNSRTYL